MYEKKGWKQVPDGLGVRIPGFHPGGPGSIPGLGDLFDLVNSDWTEFTWRLQSQGASFYASKIESPRNKS